MLVLEPPQSPDMVTTSTSPMFPEQIWEALQPLLKTDTGRTATWNGLPMLTPQGPVISDSLASGSIS